MELSNPFSFSSPDRNRTMSNESMTAAIGNMLRSDDNIDNPFSNMPTIETLSEAIGEAIGSAGSYRDYERYTPDPFDLADIGSGMGKAQTAPQDTKFMAKGVAKSAAKSGFVDVSDQWKPLEAGLMDERRARNTPSMLNPEKNWAPLEQNPFQVGGQGGMTPGIQPQAFNFMQGRRDPRELQLGGY